MAARKITPAEIRTAVLTADQMRASISKLHRRIAELEAFDPDTLRDRNDPRLHALDMKLADTIAEIFGTDTHEARRFRSRELDEAGYNYMYETPLRDVIKSVHESKAREITNLQTIIELFLEKIGDEGGSPRGRASRAIMDLDLHPEIERAAGKLFQDGHYANAIEDACKVLDFLVKMRSMRQEPSGTELMQLVFSAKNPILKFNDQQTESERSEQQGMMYLYSGAMLAIRNPRAHGLTNDHPERAVEYLSFLSMLAKALDRTTRT
jgi:uncharacterized protein (TIGR02391 family)